MGGSGKHKHNKNKQKGKSGKSGNKSNRPGSSSGSIPDPHELGQKQSNNINPCGGLKEHKDKNPNQYVDSGVDTSSWNSYSSEDQLEKNVKNKFELMYTEAFLKLLNLGYPSEVAQRAILVNGHVFGPLSALSNIVTNSIYFINTGCVTAPKIAPEGRQVFKDLKERAKFTLGVMMNLIHQTHPHVQKYEALQHLLATNFNAGPADPVTPPLVPSENENKNGSFVDGSSSAGDNKNVSSETNGSSVDGSSSSGDNKNDSSEKNVDASVQKDVRFNLTPTMASQLKMNVATLSAAYHPDMEASSTKSQISPTSSASKEFPDGTDSDDSSEEELLETNLEKWLEMESDDPRNVMILGLLKHIRELKRRVKEQKQWAQEKVIQAAKKLSHDLSDLETLRMEKVKKGQLPKIEEQDFEDKSMKRLSEMENTLKSARRQVELATESVRKLEFQNSEMRAEKEACELSKSESHRVLLEVEKRERKIHKRIMTLEKQCSQLQEQIEEQNRKKLQVQEELIRVREAQEEAEVKWRQQLKEKEMAFALVREEERLMEVAQVNFKRKHASLKQQMEMDCQFLKDDMHRLEHEMSRLKMSRHSPHMFFPEVPETDKCQGNATEVMPPVSCIQHDSFEEELICGRKCIICSKNEPSVLFLPCTHQVLCSSCNLDHCKTFAARCPCCEVEIEQRISVYGASS